MKKVLLIGLILIVIIVGLEGKSYAESYGRIVSFDNNKIMTYQQLDYMRIVSSKGHILSELQTNTYIGTEETITRMGKNLDICLIVDLSGSMDEATNADEYKKYYDAYKEVKKQFEKDIRDGIIKIYDDDGSVIAPSDILKIRNSKDYKNKLTEKKDETRRENPYVTKLEVLKNGTIELIRKIKEKYDGSEYTVRIGIVTYESKIKLAFNLTECTDEKFELMKEKIQSFEADGTTKTYAAMQFAKERVWQKDNADTLKYTILITDGLATNRETIGSEKFGLEINDIKKITDKFFTIFIASGQKVDEYKKAAEDYKNSDESLFIDSKEFYNIMTEELFDYVVTSHVNALSLITEVIQARNAKIGDTNSFFAEIDSELLNGAIMEMEYSFNIVTTEEIESIKIKDYLGDLGFDENAKLITSGETNTSFGWKKTNNGILYTTITPTMEVDENGKYKPISIKLLLTKVISIGSDITEQDNKADIEIKTKSGQIYKTADALDDGTIIESLEDFELIEEDPQGKIIRIAGKILPPTITVTDPMGNKEKDFAIVIAIVISTAVICLFAYCTRIIKKKKT
ncbi:MAG: VWA domain-containing protein [Clostridia bacterium]|nr:VWA domain-containing protein [Clostridia bacterium]